MDEDIELLLNDLVWFGTYVQSAHPHNLPLIALTYRLIARAERIAANHNVAALRHEFDDLQLIFSNLSKYKGENSNE